MLQNTWNTVALNTIAPEPWRNGGGTTQPLLAWPTLTDWKIRCSIAQIDKAGSFSSFAGVQRWFAVLAGAGVVLDIDGTPFTQTSTSAPLRFDGAAQTGCTLINGATQDFNLMLQGCTGSLQAFSGQYEHAAQAGEWLAVYSHQHETILNTNGQLTRLPPQHLTWMQCAADFTMILDSTKALLMLAMME